MPPAPAPRSGVKLHERRAHQIRRGEGAAAPAPPGPAERRGRDSNPGYGGYPHNGFQDRRIQPLCHPSSEDEMIAREGGTDRAGAPRFTLGGPGEVAEWLKALAC